MLLPAKRGDKSILYNIPPRQIGLHRKFRIWERELFDSSLSSGPVQFFADSESKPELKMLNDNMDKIKTSIEVANKKSITPIIHLPYSIRFDNFHRPFFRAYIDKIIEIAQLFTEQSYIIMHLWPGNRAEKKRIEWITKKFPRIPPAKSARAIKSAKSAKSAKSTNESKRPANSQYPILVLENMINMAEPKILGEISHVLRSASIMFCIDTAHVWGAGIDIRTAKKAQQYINELQTNKVRVGILHLNPPANAFGEIIDRHGDMDKTTMRPDVMRTFVKYGAENEIISIIERPSKSNTKEIAKMWIDIVAKK